MDLLSKPEALARVVSDVYCRQAGELGDEAAGWDELPTEVRAAMTAVAAEVQAAVREQYGPAVRELADLVEGLAPALLGDGLGDARRQAGHVGHALREFAATGTIPPAPTAERQRAAIGAWWT